jgi:hypothetical protein
MATGRGVGMMVGEKIDEMRGGIGGEIGEMTDGMDTDRERDHGSEIEIGTGTGIGIEGKVIEMTGEEDRISIFTHVGKIALR